MTRRPSTRLKYNKKCREWRANHPGYHAEIARIWRVTHPEEHREISRLLKQKHNDGTLASASNSRMLWDNHDVDYLKRYAFTQTARHIAAVLGRSYQSILMKAFKLGILMMTEDKKHGRLTTSMLN